MSKNYRDYYQSENKKEVAVQPELIEVLSEVETQPEVEAKEVIGVVYNCAKLNVRVHPSTEVKVAYQVAAGEELVIDLEGSTEDFYAVWNGAGVKGFCMKQYISIKQ